MHDKIIASISESRTLTETRDYLLPRLMSGEVRVIAHELLEHLRANVTVDWQHRESARARMRVLVKRILKRYGYPPDLADDAVQTVLTQAEILLREVTAQRGRDAAQAI
jgi:hypothetical protein